MRTGRVVHLGNSAGLCIPAQYRRALGLVKGTIVIYEVKDDALVVRTLESHAIRTRKASSRRGPGDLTAATR